MFLFLFFLLLPQSLCLRDKGTLCESVGLCVCRYLQNKEGDFMTVNVQCNEQSVLDTSYVLPNAIHTLNLSSSNLSVISNSTLFTSDALKVLLLKNNNIVRIHVGILLLPALKKLDLSYNALEFIDPEVFKYTRKLEYLDLSSNRFTTLEPKIFFYLSSLKEIILDMNKIGAQLQKTDLFHLEGLALNDGIKSISMSGIDLNTYPENFLSDAYDLRRLDLSNNNLTSLPELPFTLEYLDLSENPIKELYPEDLDPLPALKELHLNNLSISEIPAYVFASLKALEVLKLERNKNLSSFSKFAFGQEVLDDPIDFMLERFSLKSSNLKTLSSDLETPLGEVGVLDLQGNPWRCDCHLKWIKELQIPPKMTEHLRCATPIPFYNSLIMELDAKYFKCQLTLDQKSKIGSGIIITVSALFLTAIAFWLYLFLPQYYTRCRFLRQSVYPSMPYTMLPVSPGDDGL